MEETTREEAQNISGNRFHQGGNSRFGDVVEGGGGGTETNVLVEGIDVNENITPRLERKSFPEGNIAGKGKFLWKRKTNTRSSRA